MTHGGYRNTLAKEQPGSIGVDRAKLQPQLWIPRWPHFSYNHPLNPRLVSAYSVLGTQTIHSFSSNPG